MWITHFCHLLAFVKLSVAMASLPHCNCPSDSQVYPATGAQQTGEGRGRRRGNRRKKGGWGDLDVERAKGRMRAVIYSLWI